MLPDTTWRLQILDMCLNLALFDLSASSKSTLQVRASPGNISSVEHILYGEGEDRRDTNFLVAIKLGPSSTSQQIVMGIAAVETPIEPQTFRELWRHTEKKERNVPLLTPVASYMRTWNGRLAEFGT